MSAVAQVSAGKYHMKDIDRAEAYKWPVKDVQGEFSMIQLDKLHIDHKYQRDRISKARVLQIARAWSWAACGCILVARRDDGTLWVFEGQHRTMAARTRGDIDELPCLVFPSIELRDEAAAFLDANTVRGPVRMVDRFKAMLIKRDPVALKVQDMLDEYGYIVASGMGVGKLCCVGALCAEMDLSEKNCRRSFGVCVELFDGHTIHDKLFRALSYLDKHLEKHSKQSICTQHIRQKILTLGSEELLRGINAASQYHARSGAKVWADGIVRLINKGKSRRRLPPCISD